MKKNKASYYFAVLVAVLISLAQIIPFYIAINTSFKARSERSSTWMLPNNFSLDNYVVAINDGHVLRAIFNSLLITVVSVIVVCVVGAFAAYPLARVRSKLNSVVFNLFVALIMIPPLSILVPLYSMLAKWGAINTYWGIILVLSATQLPLSIFLYSNFIRTLPISIEEAASLDGANSIQILFRIVFPMLKPVTATVTIMTGVSIWNEYQLSNYLLTDYNVQSIAPAIGVFTGTQGANYGAAAAGAVLACIPMILIYIFMQRYFIEGLVAGSIK